jgi:CRISPR/Cas system-associated protein Csm6
MKVLIVSTCGTSLLTNSATDDDRQLLAGMAMMTRANLDAESLQRIDAIAAAKARELLAAPAAAARLMCAELNGIFGYAAELRPAPDEWMHILVHTDTCQGRAAATAIADRLRQDGLPTDAIVLGDLDPDSPSGFHRALSDLVEQCARQLPDYRAKQWRIVFNLVGGFKLVQGFMQTLGMFYADEQIWVFERGRLFRIPRLPVSLDASAVEVVEKHQAVFRRMLWGDVPAGECQGIPETLVYQMDGDCSYTEWGRLAWEQYRATAYREKLLPVPTRRIKWTDAFARSAKGLEPDRMRHVNERIDDLAHHQECPEYKLSRLDLKRLRGDPKPPSTHECDAWADGSAWRIFCHMEGDVLVLDSIGPGLH